MVSGAAAAGKLQPKPSIDREISIIGRAVRDIIRRDLVRKWVFVADILFVFFLADASGWSAHEKSPGPRLDRRRAHWITAERGIHLAQRFDDTL